jgi:hypothetical protein
LCAPAVLVSGVAARLLAAHGGSVFYFDEGTRRISRVSAGEKPTDIVNSVTGLTGLRVVGDRLVWATPAGVFARSIGAEGAPVERISTAFAGETPVAASQTGYVSWAVRASAPPSGAKPKKKEGRHAPVGAEGRQVVAALLGERGKPALSLAECNEWPRTFVADERDVFCCDEGTPLASIACAGGKCTHHDLGVGCPESVEMTAERIYFGADVRVFALDRKSNALTVLSKRKRYPRDLVAAGSNVYWLEGGTDLYRLRLDATPAASAELVARRMTDVVAVAADEMGAYWIARAAGASVGGAAGAKDAKDETYAIYALSMSERPR